MENILQFANTVMESVVEPAQKTTRPPRMGERAGARPPVLEGCACVLPGAGVDRPLVDG